MPLVESLLRGSQGLGIRFVRGPAKLFAATLAAAALSSCGREGTATGPSGPMSFLTGTWRGTVTIRLGSFS